MGLLNSLNAQMAQAQIELALLLDNSSENDPRVQQAKRKMIAIQELIDAERARFGVQGGGNGENPFSQLLEEYQGLEMERKFSEQTYISAQSARDAAVAEAEDAGGADAVVDGLAAEAVGVAELVEEEPRALLVRRLRALVDGGALVGREARGELVDRLGHRGRRRVSSGGRP